MDLGRHINQLRDMLGPEALLTAEADIASYEQGARLERGRAAFVLRPRSTEEVSEAVGYCVRHDIPIVPQAGNTGVVAASTPDSSGVQAILSIDRINKRFELDVCNRSVRCDAGLRLSQVNARLAGAGLQFPIDLGADPMLGGMLATNTGGSRFLRFGDVRRNVLGIKVVLADENGTVLDLMSPLRKNNTSVDWKHVFIGTSGAFGIITECEINLEFVPGQAATALLVPRDGNAVMPLLAAMERRLGSYLSAFEGMSRNAVQATVAHVPSLRNPFQSNAAPDYAILCEVTRSWEAREGEQSLDEVLENALAEIWSADEPLLSDALVAPAVELWALRHALPEGVRHVGKLVAFDLSFRRQDVFAFCDRMKEQLPLRYPGVVICDFGHIGDGGVHFVLAFPTSSTFAPGDEPALREWVYEIAVRDFGGSFSAEHGIGRKNQATYDRYTAGELVRLADGLKSMTSPGRLGVARFGANLK